MDTSLTDEEKRFVVAEMIKTSKMDVDMLVGLVKGRIESPNWLEMQIPRGRNLNQCIEAAQVMFSKAYPPPMVQKRKLAPGSEDAEGPFKRQVHMTGTASTPTSSYPPRYAHASSVYVPGSPSAAPPSAEHPHSYSYAVSPHSPSSHTRTASGPPPPAPAPAPASAPETPSAQTPGPAPGPVPTQFFRPPPNAFAQAIGPPRTYGSYPPQQPVPPQPNPPAPKRRGRPPRSSRILRPPVPPYQPLAPQPHPPTMAPYPHAVTPLILPPIPPMAMPPSPLARTPAAAFAREQSPGGSTLPSPSYGVFPANPDDGRYQASRQPAGGGDQSQPRVMAEERVDFRRSPPVGGVSDPAAIIEMHELRRSSSEGPFRGSETPVHRAAPLTSVHHLADLARDASPPAPGEDDRRRGDQRSPPMPQPPRPLQTPQGQSAAHAPDVDDPATMRQDIRGPATVN